ncbi:hypothetical protein Syun_000121 [Stephania yunnanensis]|uniref:Uncharacterized protein n=1 Tax=Stephania yunnanensis TaxID=152371 RepID=A0AAP0Q9J2_9MAGN
MNCKLHVKPRYVSNQSTLQLNNFELSGIAQLNCWNLASFLTPRSSLPSDLQWRSTD